MAKLLPSGKSLVRDRTKWFFSLFEAVCRNNRPARRTACRRAVHHLSLAMEGLEERALLTVAPTLTALSVSTTAASVAGAKLRALSSE